MALKSISTLIIFIFAALSPAAASDDQLNQDQVRRFAESIPAVTAFGDEMEKNGKGGVFGDAAEPKAGEPFKPYSRPTKLMKADHPGDYAKLNALAKKHKFKNAERWADIGDRTMLAYVALKMPPGMGAIAASLTPEMLSMMPPETRAEYEKSVVVMQAVEETPQADKDAVTPHVALLDQVMAASGEQSGAFEKLDAAPYGR